MKKLSIPLLTLLAASLFSCDLFNKVDQVTFEAKLPLEFAINESAVSSTPVSYTQTQILDATKNSDVAKYKDKIKEFKVNKISYVISGYSANGAVVRFTNGTITVASSGKTIATASSIDLQSTVDTDLTADTAGFNELAQLLKDDKSETVKLAGTFSSTPVSFTVTVYFHTTITAEVL